MCKRITLESLPVSAAEIIEAAIADKFLEVTAEAWIHVNGTWSVSLSGRHPDGRGGFVERYSPAIVDGKWALAYDEGQGTL